MDPKNILQDISEIVRNITENPNLELSEDMNAQDVEGWDSLSHVQIIYQCEAKWNVRFTLSQLGNLNTVGDLVNGIISLVNEN